MKKKSHRNDEPTVLPTNCTAVVFKPDGGVEMFVPHFDDGNADTGVVGHNIMRVSLLFGDGAHCEKLRRIADTMIEEQLAAIRSR